ncbi:hypothetical protein D917_09608 [Trichinella nativa]|uniref:Uncharacterized protein n=1 Tax=Trichinella nativa TaxID=6335 RepID=A0A1Y3EKQ7_9BILA|nr:hypothetical protein D917_09608 [Trichinella nativa]
MIDNISDTNFSVYYPDMRFHPKIVPITQAGLNELRARYTHLALCKVLYNIMRQEWPNEEKDCIIRPEAMYDISNIIELSERPHASIALSATEGTDEESIFLSIRHKCFDIVSSPVFT